MPQNGIYLIPNAGSETDMKYLGKTIWKGVRFLHKKRESSDSPVMLQLYIAIQERGYVFFLFLLFFFFSNLH